MSTDTPTRVEPVLPAPPYTLDRLMDVASLLVEHVCPQGSLDMHIMLLTRDGETLDVALFRGGGSDIVVLIRTILDMTQARASVAILESWSAIIQHDTTTPIHPLLRAVQEGKIGPSELPPELRGEVVMLLGDSRDHELRHRLYRIETDGQRRVTLEASATNASAVTRLRPIYLAENDPLLTEAWMQVQDGMTRGRMESPAFLEDVGGPEQGGDNGLFEAIAQFVRMQNGGS